ncbi:MAG: hypothetical protein ACK5PB_21610 [Pirellula sp.]
MSPQSLLQLVASLLMLACCCQSGMAAIQWEMTWQSPDDFACTTAPASDEGTPPTIDLSPFTGSMESPSVSGQSISVPCCLGSRRMDIQLDSQPLRLAIPPGEAIRFSWRSMKVPIQTADLFADF